MSVAIQACQTQIGLNRSAPVFLRNDVIDLKSEQATDLWNEAVFTAGSSPAKNQLSERFWDIRHP
jgi:hypothetical protein